jgi:hypothetical protein
MDSGLPSTRFIPSSSYYQDLEEEPVPGSLIRGRQNANTKLALDTYADWLGYCLVLMT